MKQLKHWILAALLWTLPSTIMAAEIKIGVIVPLSGDMALHGTEIQRAMELALSQAKGNELKHAYQLYFEDNQLDGKKSVTAAQKLINIDNVDVIVTLWPPTASVVVPLTERAGILHYTIAWDPKLARSHKLLLSHQVMVDEIARASLRQLYNQGKTRIAFIHLQETGFDLGAEKIRSLAPEECVQLVADETFSPTETDFRSLLLKIKQKKPDAFLVWSVMPSMDLLIRQIRANFPTSIEIAGYLDFADDTKSLEGASYISEMYASEQFAKAYQGAYRETPQSKGANAYDIMNLLITAYESAPNIKLKAAGVKDFIRSQGEVAGAVGRFSVSEDGNSSYAPVVRKIKNGQRVLEGMALEASKCGKHSGR